MQEIKDYMTYKGRPLVREGNILCYGRPTDPVMVILNVLTTKKVQDQEVCDLIFVQLQTTSVHPDGIKVIKQAETFGLYEALDIGNIWLDRELKKNK